MQRKQFFRKCQLPVAFNKHFIYNKQPTKTMCNMIRCFDFFPISDCRYTIYHLSLLEFAPPPLKHTHKAFCCAKINCPLNLYLNDNRYLNLDFHITSLNIHFTWLSFMKKKMSTGKKQQQQKNYMLNTRSYYIHVVTTVYSIMIFFFLCLAHAFWTQYTSLFKFMHNIVSNHSSKYKNILKQTCTIYYFIYHIVI